MKKLFTTFAFAVFASVFLFAKSNAPTVTVLATYEVPMGQELITNTVFCETPPKSWVTFTGVVANPVKDPDMNNTNNCYLVKEGVGADWWANFLNFRLTQPITITQENRYLHILHYRSVLNDNWMIQLNLDWQSGNVNRFDRQNAKAGVWEDIVIDMQKMIDTNTDLTKFLFGVSMDWNGVRDNPAGDFYFDEVILSSSPLPRGINILQDTEMSLFFGNTASYNKWVKLLDLQLPENTSEIVANPFTTQMSVLNSTQIMKFNKSAAASWWRSGPRVKLPGILPVGGNGPTTLHAMINIPEMEAGKDYYIVQLNAKDFTGKQVDSGDALKYWVDDKGKWVDLVLDVSSLGYVAEFSVRVDIRRDAADAYITAPAGVFYLDAVAIDKNTDPRTVVVAPTAIKNPTVNNVTAYSLGKNVVVEGEIISIEIYNLSGQSVKKLTVNSFKSVIPMTQNGVYLVKSVLSNGTVSTNKVMIK